MMKKSPYLPKLPAIMVPSHYRLWDNPYTGMVRLQIGHYAGQRRVEVYCNNQWGVVCNSESIDYHAATTICTQLGYNDYISFFPVL